MNEAEMEQGRRSSMSDERRRVARERLAQRQERIRAREAEQEHAKEEQPEDAQEPAEDKQPAGGQENLDGKHSATGQALTEGKQSTTKRKPAESEQEPTALESTTLPAQEPERALHKTPSSAAKERAPEHAPAPIPSSTSETQPLEEGKPEAPKGTWPAQQQPTPQQPAIKTQPQAAQSHAAQSQASQPPTTQPQAEQPRTAQPQAAQPRTAQPQAGRPNPKQSRAAQAQAAQPARIPQAEVVATKETPKKRSRYVASIDGLRAFAVLAVIFYHMHLNWAPGGLMGVTVFFVISGYLITGLLVNERETTGRIDLPAFWLRRVRRLFPAIALAVVGTAALCTLLNQGLLDKMRPDIVPSLFFFNNWWQIFHEVSYFEAAGAPSPLTHFWSLSIEEQFYVVWPLLLLALFALPGAKKDIGGKHHGMQVFVLVLAALSAGEMALLYDPLGDPSRVYYGTDTRAFSLLVGAWLAFAWPSAAFGGDRTGTHGWRRFLANVGGVLALAGLVLIVVFTSGFSDFPYYGGIAVTSLLSAALIGVLVVPGTWVDRLLALKPLVWIGKRSYGMYLWHFPILLLTVDATSTLETPVWVYFVQFALILLVSDLSYRFVENPIRQYGFLNWLRGRTDASHRADVPGAEQAAPAHGRGKRRALVMVAPACCCAVVLGVAGAGVAGMQFPSASTPFSLPRVAASLAESYLASETSADPDAESDSDELSTSPDGSTSSDAASAPDGSSAGANAEGAPDAQEPGGSAPEPQEPTVNEDAIAAFSEQRFNEAGEPIYEPLLIGDSVTAACDDAFLRAFPYGHLDSVVSRNVWESPYADYLATDQVGTYVIFCLGTNNNVVDWQIDDELLAGVTDDKKVYLVNTRSPEEWVESTNQALADAVDRNPCVVKVIDWYGYSAGHDEWFAGDGTHLNPEGEEAYMQFVRSEIVGS